MENNLFWLIKQKEVAEKKTLKYKELAKKSGVSRITIWRILNNPNHPISARNVEKLCNFFQCSPADLFTKEESNV